jgi:3-oxoacyl-(acyl-carrier-protein) synthase
VSDARVAISATGLACGLGLDLPTTLAALAAGAAAPHDLDDAPAHSPVARAAPAVVEDLEARVPGDLESQVKFLNGSGRLAVLAAREAMQALETAGLDLVTIPPRRRSLYLAQLDAADWDCNVLRPAVEFVQQTDEALTPGQGLNKQISRRTKPFFLLEGLKNNCFSFVTQWFEMRGPNTSTAGISHADFQAFDAAVRAVEDGRTDLGMVLGAAVTSEAVARADVLRSPLLAARTHALVPGDAAACVVLESDAALAASGRPALAFVEAQIARHGPRGPEGPTPETLRGAVTTALGDAAVQIVVAPPEAWDMAQGLPALADVRWVDLQGALGHTGPAAFVADVVAAVAKLEAGERALVLSSGLLGQAGALLLRKA